MSARQQFVPGSKPIDSSSNGAGATDPRAPSPSPFTRKPDELNLSAFKKPHRPQSSASHGSNITQPRHSIEGVQRPLLPAPRPSMIPHPRHRPNSTRPEVPIPAAAQPFIFAAPRPSSAATFLNRSVSSTDTSMTSSQLAANNVSRGFAHAPHHHDQAHIPTFSDSQHTFLPPHSERVYENHFAAFNNTQNIGSPVHTSTPARHFVPNGLLEHAPDARPGHFDYPDNSGNAMAFSRSLPSKRNEPDDSVHSGDGGEGRELQGFKRQKVICLEIDDGEHGQVDDLRRSMSTAPEHPQFNHASRQTTATPAFHPQHPEHDPHTIQSSANAQEIEHPVISLFTNLIGPAVPDDFEQQLAAAEAKWCGCSMEEWEKGAEEIADNFRKVFDFATETMVIKMKAHATLQKAVSDRKVILRKGNSELNDVQQKLVREAASISGAVSAARAL